MNGPLASHRSSFGPLHPVRRRLRPLVLKCIFRGRTINDVRFYSKKVAYYLGVSPNFKVAVGIGQKFHWYLRTLSLKFQKTTSKIEVFQSLSCLQRAKTRKLKVLKNPRNLATHKALNIKDWMWIFLREKTHKVCFWIHSLEQNSLRRLVRDLEKLGFKLSCKDRGTYLQAGYFCKVTSLWYDK